MLKHVWIRANELQPDIKNMLKHVQIEMEKTCNNMVK